jgi:thiol-disulfide isomerase/thioredoxin
MNRISGILTILLLTCSAAWPQNNRVIIRGQIVGYDGVGQVHYSVSKNYGQSDYLALKPDSLGKFAIIRQSSGMELFTMLYYQNNTGFTCKLIIYPGCTYSFVSKGYDSRDSSLYYSPEISGCNAEGQMNYNRISNGLTGIFYYKDWDLENPESLLDTLDARIARKESVFAKLLSEKKINQEFYDISCLNIEYFTAYQLAETISETWQVTRRGIADPKLADRVIAQYPGIFERHPVKGARMEYLFNSSTYISMYIDYLQESQSGKFSPHQKKGLSDMHFRLETAKEILSDSVYKYYALPCIMNYAAGMGKESAEFAREYFDKFPEMVKSRESEILNNYLLPKVREFYGLSEKELPEDVILLDNEKPVLSFKDLLQNLHGKPFLIDYWGTWCAPCRYEFQFGDTLRSFLKQHGISMVYIAYEPKPDREVWTNLIKQNNLAGYHFISNKTFKTDLEKLTGEISAYPTYIIVDADGNIVQAKAYAPSDGDKLFRQLTERLRF